MWIELGLTAAGALLSAFGTTRAYRYRRIRKAKKLLPAQEPNEYAQREGTVKLTEPAVSPITKQECALYSYEIQSTRADPVFRMKFYSKVKELKTDRLGVDAKPFEIEQNGSTLTVAPQGAECVLPWRKAFLINPNIHNIFQNPLWLRDKQFTKENVTEVDVEAALGVLMLKITREYKKGHLVVTLTYGPSYYLEASIEPGDTVSVYGTASKPELITTLERDKLYGSMKREMAFLFVFGAIFLATSLALLF